MTTVESAPRIAVVIPCYRVRDHIMQVVTAIGDEVDRIYVIDDSCPEKTGDFVEANASDDRVCVLRNQSRSGVGGATLAGYRRALEDGCDVIVKLDGDGQMDPGTIPRLIDPVLSGTADYAKGNRFFRLEDLREMPWVRLVGNGILSFLTKLSTGYWDLFDPTNGFTAIHATVARALPLDKISRGYFFESDMLFRLATIRAVVTDVPMPAQYAGGASNLRIARVIGPFLAKHSINTFKRMFYGYFLRSFNIASVELLVGFALVGFGTTVGVREWLRSAREQIDSSSGTVMLAALPVILGFQMLIAFQNYDMQSQPRTPLHPQLRDATSRSFSRRAPSSSTDPKESRDSLGRS
jgi:glycosyltransferase involved in cell wall biosynthesis